MSYVTLSSLLLRIFLEIFSLKCYFEDVPVNASLWKGNRFLQSCRNFLSEKILGHL